MTARTLIAALCVLALALAPAARASTCIYCDASGNRRSCYTGFPLAPNCRWRGSSVSLSHCGFTSLVTSATCEETWNGMQLKAVLDYDNACPNPDATTECSYTGVVYVSKRRRSLLENWRQHAA